MISERATLRFLLPLGAMLAAFTSSPQKAVMPSPSPASGTTVQSASPGNAGPQADSPAEAAGRRELSTAFVRVGPDGHLTVTLRDGRVLVLRDVVMRARDYCGALVAGDPGRTKYCGGYADVVAARPGGGPSVSDAEPVPGAPAAQ